MAVQLPSKRHGVTLVEALIVLVVVAVLVAIALPRYQTMKERALSAALRGDLLALRVAQEGFFAEHHQYATTLTELNYQPATPGVVIDLVSTDPVSGWTATASAPFAPGSGSCFLSEASAGGGSGGSGVECNSYSFQTKAIH